MPTPRYVAVVSSVRPVDCETLETFERYPVSGIAMMLLETMGVKEAKALAEVSLYGCGNWITRDRRGS